MSGYSSYNTAFSYNDSSPSNGQYQNTPAEFDQSQLRQPPAPSYNYAPEDNTDMNVKMETHRNIKLLHEIVNASVVDGGERGSGGSGGNDERKRKKKSKSSKYSKDSNEDDDNFYMNFFMEYVKEPIIMIVLYILFHTETVNDFISNYLPLNYNNPMNLGKYYGVRGFIYVVSYYVLRNYKC
jgi:hypothetical protein